MKIDNEYLAKLLAPLENNEVPTLEDYLEQLRSIGIVVCDDNHRIERKFETHLRYLSSKRIISNVDGVSDLKSLGIYLGADGHLSIDGHVYIMKAEEEKISMAQNISIGTINSDHVQVGNKNTQTITINIQEIVEKVADSNDHEAKSLLKSLLENDTVASVIGAGASSLISILFSK